MTEAVLVIDTGSSSMRGVLFALDGTPLHTIQQKYTMTVGSDGSAEMDIRTFSEALTRICSGLSFWTEQNGVKILALSLDSQRSSVLPVNTAMEPLSPIFMWYDKRSLPLVKELSEEQTGLIYHICGMHPTGVSSAPKMLWIKKNLPSLYEKARKLIGIHDYLLYVVTGQTVTDAGCASRSALMDIRTLRWSDELLSLFDIDRDKLLPILPSGAIAGSVCKPFSEATGLPAVPVISAGGDQQCCVLGQGIDSVGTLSVNSGSASYLTIPVKDVVLDPRREVNLSSYCASVPYVLEASNTGSGTVQQWFNRTFYHAGAESTDLTAMNAEIEAEPAGSRGVICFPDFAGHGCPETEPNAKGLFVGIGLQNTRGSFARALLEGLCFDIADCVRYLRELSGEIRCIRSTGGLTNFDAFNQMLADILGHEILVNQAKETTALGNLVSALTALRIIPDAASFFNKYPPRYCLYTPDSEAVSVYQDIRQKRDVLRSAVRPSLYQSSVPS